jgi:hypothetical protein
MAITTLRSKIERISVPITGVANAFTSNGVSIQGRIIKLAIVSGGLTTSALSGQISITDATTGENIWVQSATAGVSFQTTHKVIYPRVSGSTTAGVTSGLAGDNEWGFPCTSINVALTGITPATGTATCNIWFQ